MWVPVICTYIAMYFHYSVARIKPSISQMSTRRHDETKAKMKTHREKPNPVVSHMTSGACGGNIWALRSLGGLTPTAPPPPAHMGSRKPSLLSADRSVQQMCHILAFPNILVSPSQLSLHINNFTHRPLRASLQRIQSHYTFSDLQQSSEALPQGAMSLYLLPGSAASSEYSLPSLVLAITG